MPLPTAIEALRRGADWLILKPFEGNELVQSVQRALEQSQHKQDQIRLQALRPLFDITEALFTETNPRRLQTLVLNAVSNICNSSSSIAVAVNDTQVPVLTIPPNWQLECPADTRTNVTGVATAMDECGAVSVSFADTVTPGCGGSKVVARTWTATDLCGNLASAIQTITVRDSTKSNYADKLDYQVLQTTLENNLASLKYQAIGGLTKYLKLGMITSIEIPLLSLDIQHEIVARIEKERAIVEGNRVLIRIYEEKIKKVIERVWES